MNNKYLLILFRNPSQYSLYSNKFYRSHSPSLTLSLYLSNISSPAITLNLTVQHLNKTLVYSFIDFQHTHTVGHNLHSVVINSQISCSIKAHEYQCSFILFLTLPYSHNALTRITDFTFKLPFIVFECCVIFYFFFLLPCYYSLALGISYEM